MSDAALCVRKAAYPSPADHALFQIKHGSGEACKTTVGVHFRGGYFLDILVWQRPECSGGAVVGGSPAPRPCELYHLMVFYGHVEDPHRVSVSQRVCSREILPHTHTHTYIYIYMWPRLLGPIQLIVHIIEYEPKVESYLKIYVPMLSFVLQRSRTPVGAIKLFVICNNNKLLPGGRWRTGINIYNVSSSLISLNLFATLYAPVLS